MFDHIMYYSYPILYSIILLYVFLLKFPLLTPVDNAISMGFFPTGAVNAEDSEDDLTGWDRWEEIEIRVVSPMIRFISTCLQDNF